ncbi:hypothetical protein [Okeania sp. SIO3I5]|uniref:hypothetical protein n=1 Tax=Okeania sp. SIO3I5 TaxID=2607805 RepID=UPI0025E4A148|nr:hypothetical protein [Okeania sp. SIO3I5]
MTNLFFSGFARKLIPHDMAEYFGILFYVYIYLGIFGLPKNLFGCFYHSFKAAK